MLDVREIPPNIGYYLAGFTDGEGSFNVSFRPRSDYVFPWKVSLCFNVSQRETLFRSLSDSDFFQPRSNVISASSSISLVCCVLDNISHEKVWLKSSAFDWR